MERAVTPAPVPLSGSLNLSAVSRQARVSRPCFMPQPFWDPPFRVFPSYRALHPSRSRCFLAVIHRRAEVRCPGPCHRRFPRLPRFHAVAWFPRQLWAPFQRTSVIASRLPWDPQQRSHFIPSASPTSKLRSLYESVRTSSGCPSLAAVTLLGFLPSEAFSSRASGPRPARALRPEHASSPEGSDSRPRGPRDPPDRVRPPRHECRGCLVDSFRSPSGSACTASRRRPYSLGLGHPRQAWRSLTLGAFKYVESGVSPKRSPAPLGFPTSSTTSRLRRRQQPWPMCSASEPGRRLRLPALLFGPLPAPTGVPRRRRFGRRPGTQRATC